MQVAFLSLLFFGKEGTDFAILGLREARTGNRFCTFRFLFGIIAFFFVLVAQARPFFLRAECAKSVPCLRSLLAVFLHGIFVFVFMVVSPFLPSPLKKRLLVSLGCEREGLVLSGLLKRGLRLKTYGLWSPMEPYKALCSPGASPRVKFNMFFLSWPRDHVATKEME